MSQSLFERTSYKLGCSALRLKLISDADIYLFFKNSMRGGVSYIYKRYSKANNKYLKSYDPKQESKHIIYLNANNLYGYGMSKFSPTSAFKWVDAKEFDFNKYNNNSSTGCIFEVDLECLKKLRELLMIIL